MKEQRHHAHGSLILSWLKEWLDTTHIWVDLIPEKAIADKNDSWQVYVGKGSGNRQVFNIRGEDDTTITFALY
jgi:hypothetical protein